MERRGYWEGRESGRNDGLLFNSSFDVLGTKCQVCTNSFNSSSSVKPLPLLSLFDSGRGPERLIKLHKIPKLGLTYRQVALEPILPATMLHSQENVLDGGGWAPGGLQGWGLASPCPALLWLGLSESGGLGKCGVEWPLDLPVLNRASVEGGCGQQVKEKLRKDPGLSQEKVASKGCEERTPVAEGIRGSTARRAGNSRCSEWWKRGLSLSGEAEPRKRCQGWQLDAKSWDVGEGRWRLWQNWNRGRRWREGAKGLRPGPLRQPGVGGRGGLTHLWWPPRTRAPCGCLP